MAKQIGPNYLVGIHGGLCWYKMDGQYYVRKLSAIHYFKKAKRFGNTMASAERLAKASKIASIIYRSLPKHWKKHWVFRAFTGEAALLMKYEKTAEETLEFLWKRYAAEFTPQPPVGGVKQIPNQKISCTKGKGLAISVKSNYYNHQTAARVSHIPVRNYKSNYRIAKRHMFSGHERAGPLLRANP